MLLFCSFFVLLCFCFICFFILCLDSFFFFFFLLGDIIFFFHFFFFWFILKFIIKLRRLIISSRCVQLMPVHVNATRMGELTIHGSTGLPPRPTIPCFLGVPYRPDGVGAASRFEAAGRVSRLFQSAKIVLWSYAFSTKWAIQADHLECARYAHARPGHGNASQMDSTLKVLDGEVSV